MIQRRDRNLPKIEKEERRTACRLKADLACTFVRNGVVARGRVIDVSERGIFVISDAMPWVDEELEIRIRLPNRSELRLVGRVRHEGHFLSGLTNFRGFGLEVDNFIRLAGLKLKELLPESNGLQPERKYGIET